MQLQLQDQIDTLLPAVRAASKAWSAGTSQFISAIQVQEKRVNALYSRPSGVCRYGRLFWIACVFSFFFYLTNKRKNGRKYFGAKYGRMKGLAGKELSVSFTDIHPGVFPGGPKN